MANTRNDQYLPVVDVSVFQKRLDAPVMAAAGVRAVVARASDGTPRRGHAGEDAQWKPFVRAASSTDLLIGAYHFIRPQISGAVEQSRFYLQAVRGAVDAIGRPLDLPLMVDVEQYWNKVAPLPGPTMVRWLAEFLDVVENEGADLVRPGATDSEHLHRRAVLAGVRRQLRCVRSLRTGARALPDVPTREGRERQEVRGRSHAAGRGDDVAGVRLEPEGRPFAAASTRMGPLGRLAVLRRWQQRWRPGRCGEHPRGLQHLPRRQHRPLDRRPAPLTRHVAAATGRRDGPQPHGGDRELTTQRQARRER